MDVHVVGDDPVYDAVRSALSDVDVGVVDGRADDLAEARFAIVTDVAGAETFARANRNAQAGSTPWIAVEIGGVGGHPLEAVDAAISGFAPGAGCFECLQTRVAATTDDTQRADRPRADSSSARLAGAIAGRECVRLFAREEGTILGHVIELPYMKRRLLPVPGCGCGPARDRTLEREDEPLSLEEAVAHAEGAIDPRVGLLTEIGEVDSFPAPYYLATTAPTDGFSDASAPTQAAGVDSDWNTALMKAVGEALERYCGGVYREADFTHARYDELTDAVSPESLVRPENGIETFDPSAEYRWVEGENLETGDAVALPAAAVQFPQPGPRLVPAITTGLGLGSSTVDALRSGLTEVIERDATMLSWYSSDEPVGLSVDDEEFGALTRRARSEGLSVTPLLVTQDIDVPVVAVAVHREDEWPQFAVGSAAALDGTAAAVSALAEAIQNWMELRSIGPEEAEDASGAIGEYAELPEAAREFVTVDRTIEAAALGPDHPPDGVEGLEALVDRVTDEGLTPYAARLTTRDVEALGFEAVRVLVPGAQPLFTGSPFFGERAHTVPEKLGFKPRLDGPYHPYP